MKQAYVHVLIFTELTLYVERSLGCFAFIKYKKGVIFFSQAQVSVPSLFCQSAPWKTLMAEIHPMLEIDPSAEWVILPPLWIFGVYFIWN